MSLWKRIRKAFQNYLARMEKANKEVLGSGTPDCCKLNRNPKNSVH